MEEAEAQTTDSHAPAFERPVRVCNGGPNGAGWCGAPATLVCMDHRGCQWFACEIASHSAAWQTEPIESWFQRVELGVHRSANTIRIQQLEIERLTKQVVAQASELEAEAAKVMQLSEAYRRLHDLRRAEGLRRASALEIASRLVAVLSEDPAL